MLPKSGVWLMYPFLICDKCYGCQCHEYWIATIMDMVDTLNGVDTENCVEWPQLVPLKKNDHVEVSTCLRCTKVLLISNLIIIQSLIMSFGKICSAMCICLKLVTLLSHPACGGCAVHVAAELLRILCRFLLKYWITIWRLIAMLSNSVLQRHTGRELQVHDNLAEWNLWAEPQDWSVVCHCW